MDNELNFLRHFYSEARYYMGPADSDIYYMIKQSYVEGGGILPREYDEPEDADEG